LTLSTRSSSSAPTSPLQPVPTGTDITAKHRKLTAATIPSDGKLTPSDLALLSVGRRLRRGESVIADVGEGSPARQH